MCFFCHIRIKQNQILRLPFLGYVFWYIYNKIKHVTITILRDMFFCHIYKKIKYTTNIILRKLDYFCHTLHKISKTIFRWMFFSIYRSHVSHQIKYTTNTILIFATHYTKSRIPFLSKCFFHIATYHTKSNGPRIPFLGKCVHLNIYNLKGVARLTFQPLGAQ